MVDIFISYSRDNQGKVRLLAERTRALGYQIWWDDELPPHKSYSDVITEKIGQAKAAIVVWSQSAVASEWVRAEADVARNQKKLVQTVFDEATPPMPFNQIQFANLSDWNGEDDHRGWQKVVASLADLCGPPGEGEDAREPSYALPSEPPPAADDIEAGSRLPLIIGALFVIGAIAIALFVFLPGNSGESEADRAAADQESVEDEFPLGATIDDPDGFSYIRNAPSGSAAVIGRVLDGEQFFTREQNGDWWEIVTEDGARGFMHRSRIRLADESAAPVNDGHAALTPAEQEQLDDLRASQEEALGQITDALDDVGDQIESRNDDSE